MTPAKFDPATDHIFGDLDKPINSINWLIERSRGVHHYHQKSPANPGPGDCVRLMVTCSAEVPVESVHLWMTTDDWVHHNKHRFSPAKVLWKTELWTYLHEWELTLPPQPAGTMLHYKIGAQLQGSKSIVFADSQSDDFQQATHFSIFYGEIHSPAWVDNAIIYQIFVDRFNPGKGRPWNETSGLRQYFGGSIKGVTEKLSFIKKMGFNTVWLTPVFASPSHHGYDISDYYQINPKFGSMDDYLELLEIAHRQKIKVIMDFVANHCSNEHPFFQDAIKNPDSPYHDYFVWKNWPEYECFYNVRSMPKFNLAYGSPARDYLLECAQFWMGVGVDGFRLDYAHGPEQDFWVDFRKACEAVNADCWTFGEIVQTADIQATYAGGLMGTLDFLLCQALRLTFGQLKWPLSTFAGFIQRHFSYFPQGFTLPSFIDNHDMNRFLVTANQDERLLKMALTMLFILPGQPIIYYGTEAPLSQHQSIHAKGAQGFDEARLSMPWKIVETSAWPALLSILSQIRLNHPETWQTGWHIVAINDQSETLVLEKQPSQNYLLVINRSEEDQSLAVSITQPGKYRDVISHQEYTCENNELVMKLPAFTVLLLALEKS